MLLSEVAGLISSLIHLDPPLKVKIVSEEEYVTNNEGGEELLRKWSTTYPALIRGELEEVNPLLKEILGRELKAFETTLKEAFGVDDTGSAAVKQYSK